ncbi:hypothetical protein GUJ93_ZPchr0010g7981 [Zizania palustris]|uniref:Uncharacterized protein n=1 Tax=Zizania palustris TaxID=103762 RepID=A0A8J5W873_ZIZPA|nr:hypothetical protein GUJ93_ZPchr0010g7981 [Zizania palustris]
MRAAGGVTGSPPRAARGECSEPLNCARCWLVRGLVPPALAMIEESGVVGNLLPRFALQRQPGSQRNGGFGLPCCSRYTLISDVKKIFEVY